LVLQEVKASSVVLGGRLTVRLEELIFEHRLLPLLLGDVVVERVKLTRPRVKFTSLRPEPNASRRPSQAGRPSRQDKDLEKREPSERPDTELCLEVNEVSIEEGSLLWQRESGRTDLSLDGLHLVLSGLSYDPRALTLVHGLEAVGEIRASSIRWSPISARELQGRLGLDRGKIEIRSGALETENGVFDAELDLNLNQLPPGYEVRLTGIWDLRPLMDSSAGNGSSVGLVMEASGFGRGLENVKGTGTVTLMEGNLPAWPLCRAIDAELGESAFIGALHEEAAIPFRIERAAVRFQGVEVITDRGKLRFGGTAPFDGPLDLNAVFQRPSGEAVSFTVTGTLKEPVVERER
jgi:hypothetical protein